MVRVKVLLVGRHERTPEGLCACSTVTLLRADGVRLLVDTGSFGDGERLIEAQEKVWNMDAFVQSRNKILDIADAVIPGHGGMIRIKEKHAA